MFIVFEGCDGTGKTTQLQLLAEWLTKQDIEVVVTREPGGTEAGEEIREIFFRDDLDGMTELLLIMAARAQHVAKKIRPALRLDNVFVLCDRFSDSTYVYQGCKSVRDHNIEHLNNLACGFTCPDLIFFLDGSYNVCSERIAKRGNSNRFERNGKTFFEETRKAFKERSLLNIGSCVLDADRSIEDVHEDIVNMMKIRMSF
jgi:dTMP kinase